MAGGYKFGKAIVNYIKAWIFYEEGQVDLSREYIDACIDNMEKASLTHGLFYDALSNLTIGFLDVKEGNIESSKARMVQVELKMPELSSPFKERAMFFYNLLLAEVSLAENNPEKAIALLEKESPLFSPWLNPYQTERLIVYNTPFLADVFGLLTAILSF